MADLPILGVLEELRAALSSLGAGVLVAPPGAGKTTVVPLALLEAEWLGGGRIVVLEPRRLAARAAAARMSWLLGEGGVGGTVGYRIRGDTRVSRRTRVEVVTEGVLTRMLQSDPSLGGVAAVLFDEFHERSVHADLGLALALHCRSLLRPGLRLVVMSATLDASPAAALVGDAPVVASEGRLHPVETRWRRAPVEGWIEPAVVRTVLNALARDDGDFLVFLPGAAEIRRTESRLAEAGLSPDVFVVPLFGSLSREEQDRAILPSPPGRRKVVLATSIAETSLTIEGVRVVVDAGLMRVPRFDPGTGMTRLETVRVTRDAADQRRGRAGRTAPGVCYRLWTRAEERGLVPHRRPEILEADLAPLALELAVWGASADELRWLDPPPAPALAQARELLRELEAVDGNGAATDHGRRIAAIGAHPRLAHMLLRARELGMGEVGADVAALLSERDILRGEGRAPDADLRLRVDALSAARAHRSADVSTIPGQLVLGARLRAVLREASLLRSAGASAAGSEPGEGSLADPRPGGASLAGDAGAAAFVGVGELAALAYPDRVGRKRPGERGRYLLRNGRGAAFTEPQPLGGAEWLVAAEVEGGGADARILRAAPVSLDSVERLFAAQIQEMDEIAWSAGEGRVVARRVRRLGALTFSEAPLRDPPAERVSAALLDGIRDAGLTALPWTKDTRQLQERLVFLHGLDPATRPDRRDAALESSLEAWLLPFLSGMRRLGDLRGVDLAEALLAGVSWDARARLDALAPTHVEVPSGSRIRVDYSEPTAPALAVRLQEVFGWQDTPRVGGGRVPLTMRLLSPAQRPVQVTQDLASFWRDAYFEVRKDMRGRYPKHYWPEDPLRATPTRRVRPD